MWNINFLTYEISERVDNYLRIMILGKWVVKSKHEIVIYQCIFDVDYKFEQRKDDLIEKVCVSWF